MWHSTVTFKGLTATIMDMRGRARKAQPLITEMTRGLNDAVFEIYVQNLSGSKPSTAAQPLPVGVRTGTLRAGAQKQMINQFAFKVFNAVFYAGFIELGTRFMIPRRPLGDAVDQVQRKVPGEMGKTVTKIWKT